MGRGGRIGMEPKTFAGKRLRYTIRCAELRDAAELSALRVQIDGETEHMDREAGEAFMDVKDFRKLIAADSESDVRLFLVAEADGNLAGYARCEGSTLRRFAHCAEFGICVAKDYWGHGIGGALLRETLDWADSSRITKLNLSVLATNESAIRLYAKHGFETEGVLKKDRKHADGRFYDTVLMGRFHAKTASLS